MNGVLLALLLFVQGGLVPSAQTGTVSGRVFNMDGTPAARIRVAAQSMAESPTAAAEAPVLTNIVQTDAQGNYRLEGVTPGRFYIEAGLVDLPTYYPGVISITEARVVTVAGGAAMSGIDFKMGRPAGLTVRGRVKLDAGALMPPNARVLMTGGGGAITNRNVVPPADGTFAFESVPPGRYTISVLPTIGTPQLQQQVVLSDNDLEIEFVIKPTVAAIGRVVVEDGGLRPRINVRFISGTATVATASVSSAGTFNVQLFPGTYRLEVGGVPPGYRLKSISAGTMDWIKDAIVVQIGTPLPEFVVALDVDSPPPWVKVKGRLNGGLMPGLNVTLTGVNAGEILRSGVGSDGAFEFPRVIPGPYTARVEGASLTIGVVSLQINVGSVDLDNLEIAVPQTVNVSGRVVVEGTGSPGGRRLGFTISDNGAPGRPVTVAINSNGTFNLILPAGQYPLNFNTQVGNLNGYSVKSMTYGSETVLGKPIKVSVEDAGKELVVTLERSGPGGVKVSGRVTNLPGGIAQVSILGTGFNIGGPASIPTDANGVFEIPDVPPGSFTLRANSTTAGFDVSAAITVLPGKDLTGVEIPFPSLHGTEGKVVLDPDNGTTPFVPRFWLNLTGPQTITAYPREQPDGSFTIGLPLGEWTVSVPNLSSDVTLKSLSYGDRNLLTEKINVVANETKQLRMSVAPNQLTVKVGGRIILDSKLRPVDSFMRLTGGTNLVTTVNADGTFLFPRVLPATYSWCCNYGWTSITVPNRDVTDLTLRGISGRIVMEAGTLDSGSYFQANNGKGISAASVGLDGSFTLILAEGSYRFEMSALPAGTTIKSIRYGAKDLSNQTFDFTRDVAIAELTVTIGSRP